MVSVHAKVVLVGETGTGKTSIINSFLYNKFNENEVSTESISKINQNKTIKVEGGEVILELWDTAGQEKFRSLNRKFYQNANIGILVYSVTDLNSFETIKAYWHNELRQHGTEDIILGVAGNKTDILDEIVVEEEEGKKYAEEIFAIFSITSCKMGIGIDSFFQNLAEEYFKTAHVKKRKHISHKLGKVNQKQNNCCN